MTQNDPVRQGRGRSVRRETKSGSKTEDRSKGAVADEQQWSFMQALPVSQCVLVGDVGLSNHLATFYPFCTWPRTEDVGLGIRTKFLRLNAAQSCAVPFLWHQNVALPWWGRGSFLPARSHRFLSLCTDNVGSLIGSWTSSFQQDHTTAPLQTRCSTRSFDSR